MWQKMKPAVFWALYLMFIAGVATCAVYFWVNVFDTMDQVQQLTEKCGG